MRRRAILAAPLAIAAAASPGCGPAFGTRALTRRGRSGR